jgi:hypothetical protein
MRTAHRRQRGDVPEMRPDDYTRAACAEHPDVEFFPTQGNDRPAKAICATCPVRLPCLDTAIETRAHDDHGILGGMNPAERNRERSRRERAARRKAAR